MQCKIDDLPDEVLEYILSLLPPYKDLQECMYVSKKWCQATKNVIKHNKAYFEKSVAYGSLFWNSWSETHCTRTITKRHSHSACTYGNSMYVFGGSTTGRTTFNDLWKLDFETRKWVRPITTGSYPSPKRGATMLCYKKCFILFGGWSHLLSPFHLGQHFNELHVYSIESNRWIAIHEPETPPPISSHSASIHENFMVVFGGLANGQSSNDIWCLNLDSYCWKKQETSSLKPLPRYGQSQIPLDDKHLLILGGCTGPNVPMNDAWLLTMEDPLWTWRKVNMYHTESAPTRIWCHQACKVGNCVIVLSKTKKQSQPSEMSMSVGKPVNQPHTSNVLFRERSRSVREIDRDENVNGRRGFLQRSSLLKVLSNPMPVHVGTNFRRIEHRLRNRRVQSKAAKSIDDTLAIFVLNISNILCDKCSASWVPLKQSDQTGPDERILYSLVLGRGELILFGGLRKKQATLQGYTDIDDSEVFNDLHFINPPRYII